MKILRRKLVIRSFSIFLVLEILTSAIAPSISWALTDGPTAPEAFNFEPVDTTDMVNLFNGDMTYGLPLLEVPGPHGGYPLSLSYHAGIQPELEASWVGLGWSLNPGSISRVVNGYADDYKDVNAITKLYWNGQSRTTTNVGVTVPITAGASITAGITFTNHSHRGFSYTPYAYGSMTILPGIGVQASSSGEASIGFTNPILQSFQQSHESGKAEFGASLGAFSLNASEDGIGINVKGKLSSTLGITINSKGVKGKLSVGGISKEANREGNISTISETTNLNLGLVDIQRNYVRQWIDEENTVKTNGAIYLPTTKLNYTDLEGRAHDAYDLLPETPNASDAYFEDAERKTGGTFPDYDDYTVMAQGVSGNIRPYHFYGYLYRQNRNDNGTAVVRSVPLGGNNSGFGFRFVNDFSNRFLFDPSVPTYDYTAGQMNMNFNTGSIVAGKDGRGYVGNRLAGSKHVEWHKNSSLSASQISASGFDRSTCPDDQIGGFSITNESGVTYHFLLPVYSYNEFKYTRKIIADSETYSSYDKPEKYAYAWMLTSITGPDYVDRGPDGSAADGIVNEYDWGYWVDLGYKKNGTDYKWRNPTTGMKKDVDNNFETYSRGVKEIYNLHYVKTASHTALFKTSERNDGRSVETYDGGFSSLSSRLKKLDNVYLLTNKDVVQAGGVGLLTDIQTTDIANIEYNSTKIIDFSYGYELAPFTENSFDTNVTTKLAKLTLKSIATRGKRGATGLLPPIKFGYELETPIQVYSSYSVSTDKNTVGFLKVGSGLVAGDILRFQSNSKDYYGLVESNTSGYHTLAVIYGDRPQLISGSTTFTQTKNPPYDKDRYDMWGFYKSDFKPGISGESRMTTAVSGRNVDVWSLRQVKTSVGNTINLTYEPDYYDEVAVSRTQTLRVKNAVKVDNSKIRIYFHNDGLSLYDYFSNDDDLVPISIIGAYQPNNLQFISSSGGCSCTSINYSYHQNFADFKGDVVEIDDAGKSILFDAPSLISALSAPNMSTLTEQICGGDYGSCSYNVLSDYISYVAGGVVYAANKRQVGGGIRVKELQLANNGKVNHVFYEYSGGMTVYEPVTIMDLKYNETHYNAMSASQKVEEYKEASIIASKQALRKYYSLVNLVRELPAPGVTYEIVKVKSAHFSEGVLSPNPNFLEYKFQTYKDNFVAINKEAGVDVITNTANKQVSGMVFTKGATQSITLYDIMQAIGSIKYVRTYNTTNGQLLMETSMQYLHDAYVDAISSDTKSTAIAGYAGYSSSVNTKFSSIGVINESYAESRVFKNAMYPSQIELIGLTSKRKSYPSILISQSTKNFKSNIESKSTTVGFDFFSGEVNAKVETDGYGKYYKTLIGKAHEYYSAMRSKVDGGKHMLTQEAYTKTYRVDPANFDNHLGVVGASAQTWSNSIPAVRTESTGTSQATQVDVWRKSASYSFAGNNETALTSNDGLTAPADFSDFTSWTSGTPAATWQKNNEITLYDVNSNSLEMKGLDELFVSKKLDTRHETILATAVNAKYDEFAFSGAEDELVGGKFGGEVSKAGIISTDKSHTGTKSLKVIVAGGTGFKFIATPTGNRSFFVNVWSDRNDGQIKYKFNGVTRTATLKPIKQAGAWYLLSAPLLEVSSGTSVEIWTEASVANTYFDDFRVHPNDASMTSYVYNSWGELTHILDANNLYTEFRYDDIGRLKSTHRETLQSQYGVSGIVQVSQIDYNYGALSSEKVSITASSSGNTGSVSPSGIVNVVQGKEDKSFLFIENCSSPKLQNIRIDGTVLNLAVPKTVLFDGTEVLVNGKTITFRNVQSNHTLSGEFYTEPAGSGRAYCYLNAQGCRDGSYEYYYYEICGNPGTRYRVWDLASIPEGLRTMIPAEGCPVSSGTNCQQVQQQ